MKVMQGFFALLIFLGLVGVAQWLIVAELIPFEASSRSVDYAMSKFWTFGELLRGENMGDHVFFLKEARAVTAVYSGISALIAWLLFVIFKSGFVGGTPSHGGGYYGRFVVAFFVGLVLSVVFALVFAVDTKIEGVLPLIVIPIINALFTAGSFLLCSDLLPICHNPATTAGTYRFK